MKLNHNLLAWLFPLIVTVLLAVFVYCVPAIGLAPEETTLKILLKLAIFIGASMLQLRMLGGWQFSVTQTGKEPGIKAIHLIACAIIIATGMVVAGR
jgi:hypothetical protein